jgi:hypothetical protein
MGAEFSKEEEEELNKFVGAIVFFDNNDKKKPEEKKTDDERMDTATVNGRSSSNSRQDNDDSNSSWTTIAESISIGDNSNEKSVQRQQSEKGQNQKTVQKSEQSEKSEVRKEFEKARIEYESNGAGMVSDVTVSAGTRALTETLTELENTLDRFVKNRQAINGYTYSENSAVPYSGYGDVCSKLHKIGEEPIGCSVTSRQLRMKLKSRLSVVNEEIQYMSETYNKDKLSALQKEKMKIFKRKRFLLSSVIAALANQCDKKTKLLRCKCVIPVLSPDDTCSVCRVIIQDNLKNSTTRILRSDMLGPAKCKCTACLKFLGAWNLKDDKCTCYMPEHEDPLQMCTVCLCQLAVEQYIEFAPEALTMEEQALYELRRRDNRLSRRMEECSQESDKRVYRDMIGTVQHTLMALIPDNAYEGCNRNKRLNACKCPSKVVKASDMCAHCAWLVKHYIGDKSGVYTINCRCMKCAKHELPPCACDEDYDDDYFERAKQIPNMCISCLCRFALELDAAQKIERL